LEVKTLINPDYQPESVFTSNIIIIIIIIIIFIYIVTVISSKKTIALNNITNNKIYETNIYKIPYPYFTFTSKIKVLMIWY